jgi:hypothetical protein
MPIPPIGVPTISAPAGPAALAAFPKASFGAALRAQAPPRPSCPPAQHVARAALENLEGARQRLDAALAEARRGRTFTAQELLALQADAYRYSQTVEVASKVVEQGAQTVKQAVNTQV